MATRKANNVGDVGSPSSNSHHHQNQQQRSPRSRSPRSRSPRSRSPSRELPASDSAGGGSEMFGEFQDWCLRTYGDSGKTKTVTRRKYNKILQTLLQGDEENNNGVFIQEKNSNHINAKFKFWVKSKGFQVGTLQDGRNGASDRPVLYVPIKATDSPWPGAILRANTCCYRTGDIVGFWQRLYYRLRGVMGNMYLWALLTLNCGFNNP